VVLGLYKVVMVELRDQMLLLYCSTASNTTRVKNVFNVVVVGRCKIFQVFDVRCLRVLAPYSPFEVEN